MRAYDFREKTSQCLIAFLAVLLCLLIPIYGFAQEESDGIEKLIELLKSPTVTVASSAAYFLGRKGPEAGVAVPSLIEALENKDKATAVRSNAARALGWIGVETIKAVPALIKALEDKGNTADVRISTEEALGLIGTEANGAVSALIEALEDKSNASDVRYNAVGALSHRGVEAKRAGPALIKALLTDPEYLVRHDAVFALDGIGAGADAVPALIESLKQERDSRVRQVAIRVLIRISRGLYYFRTTEMLPTLKEAYEFLKDDPDPEVKQQIDELKSIIDDFESLRWTVLMEKMELWVLNHPWVSTPVAIWLLLLICWVSMFRLRPLWLLSVSAYLNRYKIKIPNTGISLSLDKLLLVSLFHSRSQALNSTEPPNTGRFMARIPQATSGRKVKRTGAGNILQVFLCHSSSDKVSVRNLYQKLRADGFAPWLDEENLLPGQNWGEEIHKAVKHSDIVLVCLSQRALGKKGYLHKEIKEALDAADEQPEGTIFLIPVKLEVCDIPDRLNHLHWVDLFEEQGYARLLKALHTRAKKI